jgi:predicted TIM-barrel fold metal-dependent hydrolase
MVDCHAHIIDAGVAQLAARAFEASPFTWNDYERAVRPLGVKKAVLVNASCYGSDNTPTLRALTSWPACLRGVATVRADCGDKELRTLSAAGFTAARLMSTRPEVPGPADFPAIAKRVAPHGWHLEINVGRAEEWLQMERALAHSPCAVVFEHLGRVRGDEGTASAGFRCLVRLLTARRDFRIKVSSLYRLSTQPDLADLAPIVRALAGDFADRLMWGSNLPHLDWTLPRPGDAETLAQLLAWVDAPASRDALLDTNARKLYRLEGNPAEAP